MITTPSLKDIRFLYKSLKYNNRFDKHVLRQQRKPMLYWLQKTGLKVGTLTYPDC